MADVSKIREGMGVYDVDGRWIGDVVQRGIGRSLVAYGFFTRQLLVVDDDAVADVGADEVWLGVSRRFLMGRHARLREEPPYLVERKPEPAPGPAPLERPGERPDVEDVAEHGGSSARVQRE